MILKAQTNKFGYYYIILTKISKQTTTKIHRLVGTHFIPFIVNKNQLNHIDGIKHNNYTSNLEWCTASENQLHAIKKGLVIRKYGISSKFKEIDIQNIFELDKTMMRKDIAEKYNVCRSTISEILNRNNWIMANIP